MKKILLLLFVPISLSAQFEDDYYIFTEKNEFYGTSYLIDFNISNNTENQQIELVSEEGSYFLTSNGVLLTYFPNNPFLLGGFLIHFFSEEPEGSFILNKFNDLGIVDTELGDIGGYSTGGSGMTVGTNVLGMSGIIGSEDHMEIYAYRSRYGIDPSENERTISKIEFHLIDFGVYDIESELVQNITQITNYRGLAHDRSGNYLYFIGKNDNNENKFYRISINDNQLTELNSNFGTAPCCEYTMHFMQGQNKIMMADFVTGDFYTYDLNTHLVELYAETDLQYVTGIVNKQDFLGNVEVYNQGEIKIYPNPVKENLYIDTDSQIEKIELFNIIGQKLKEFGASTKTLNLSNEAKGIYILKIQLKNGKTETKKIIKN